MGTIYVEMKECLRDGCGGKTVLETGQRKESQEDPGKSQSVEVSLPSCWLYSTEHTQYSVVLVTIVQPAPPGAC